MHAPVAGARLRWRNSPVRTQDYRPLFVQCRLLFTQQRRCSHRIIRPRLSINTIT
jgi:hypothetical protein